MSVANFIHKNFASAFFFFSRARSGRLDLIFLPPPELVHIEKKKLLLLLNRTVQKHSRQWHTHSHFKNQSQERFITGKFPGLQEAP